MKTLPLLYGLFAVLAAACSMVQPAVAPLGTEQNPVKLAFLPSTDTAKVLSGGEALTRMLERETGLRFKISVPTSYTATIEAMGTTNVDIGWLAPLAYVLAHDRIGAEPLLASVRGGSTSAASQVIVRADSGITTLDGLRGRIFAFPDQTSPTGFLFPDAYLVSRGIDATTYFSQTTYAGGHDRVVWEVYNLKADGGVTFGESAPGLGVDARTTVQGSLTDVLDKVRVIARTDPIPNDTLTVRRGLPPDLVEQIRAGLLRAAASEPGLKSLRDLYRIDGLGPITDAEFAAVRAAVEVLDLDLDEEIARRPRP